MIFSSKKENKMDKTLNQLILLLKDDDNVQIKTHAIESIFNIVKCDRRLKERVLELLTPLLEDSSHNVRVAGLMAITNITRL